MNESKAANRTNVDKVALVEAQDLVPVVEALAPRRKGTILRGTPVVTGNKACSQCATAGAICCRRTKRPLPCIFTELIEFILEGKNQSAYVIELLVAE